MELYGSVAGWDVRDWRLADGPGRDEFDFTAAAIAIQSSFPLAILPSEWGEEARTAWLTTSVVLHAYYETYVDDDVTAFEAVLYAPTWGWVGIEVEYFPPDDEADSDLLDIETYIYAGPDPHALTIGADGEARLLEHLVPERFAPENNRFLSDEVAAALPKP